MKKSLLLCTLFTSLYSLEHEFECEFGPAWRSSAEIIKGSLENRILLANSNSYTNWNLMPWVSGIYALKPNKYFFLEGVVEGGWLNRGHALITDATNSRQLGVFFNNSFPYETILQKDIFESKIKVGFPIQNYHLVPCIITPSIGFVYERQLIRNIFLWDTEKFLTKECDNSPIFFSTEHALGFLLEIPLAITLNKSNTLTAKYTYSNTHLKITLTESTSNILVRRFINPIISNTISITHKYKLKSNCELSKLSKSKI